MKDYNQMTLQERVCQYGRSVLLAQSNRLEEFVLNKVQADPEATMRIYHCSPLGELFKTFYRSPLFGKTEFDEGMKNLKKFDSKVMDLSENKAFWGLYIDVSLAKFGDNSLFGFVMDSMNTQLVRFANSMVDTPQSDQVSYETEEVITPDLTKSELELLHKTAVAYTKLSHGIPLPVQSIDEENESTLNNDPSPSDDIWSNVSRYLEGTVQ